MQWYYRSFSWKRSVSIRSLNNEQTIIFPALSPLIFIRWSNVSDNWPILLVELLLSKINKKSSPRNHNVDNQDTSRRKIYAFFFILWWFLVIIPDVAISVCSFGFYCIFMLAENQWNLVSGPIVWGQRLRMRSNIHSSASSFFNSCFSIFFMTTALNGIRLCIQFGN